MTGTGPVKRLMAALTLLMLTGCAAAPIALLPVALPALISGAGSGISYTFTNIAYKTTSKPMEEVERALLVALGRMSLEVKKLKEEKNSVVVRTKTRKHDIIISLERLTPTLTKIRVNAKRFLFIKDKTTAFEIIFQTERALFEKVEAACARNGDCPPSSMPPGTVY